MKKTEFLQLVDQYGINLNKLSIMIDKVIGWEGAHGVYFKNGTWFFYSADGRNHIDESPFEDEDEAFERMMRYVFVALRSKRYLTMAIDKDVVKIGKDTVCRFIQEEYAMSAQQAEAAWTYLKQDMHILFEFKYYIAKGEFVPEKYCYKVKGYSAEQLYTTTDLGVLDAFNYLIYLGSKPKEALANLKKLVQEEHDIQIKT